MKNTTLTIDGKTLLIAYDFNLIAEAEEVTGCNLLKALENLTDITAKQLRGLFYASIIGQLDAAGAVIIGPSITLKEVGNLIKVDTIGPITSALADAYNLSIKEPEQSEPEPAVQ